MLLFLTCSQTLSSRQTLSPHRPTSLAGFTSDGNPSRNSRTCECQASKTPPCAGRASSSKSRRMELDPVSFPRVTCSKRGAAAVNCVQTLFQRMPSAEVEPQANLDPPDWQPALPPGGISRLQASEGYECKRLVGAQLCLLQRRLLVFGLPLSLKAQSPFIGYKSNAQLAVRS